MKRLCVALAVAACGDNALAPGPWGPPERLLPASTSDDDDPSLTSDLLELYFNREQDIYAATRPSLSAPWSTPVRIAELSTPGFETTPEIAGDGLSITFASDGLGGRGGLDIFLATRPSRTAAWGAPVEIDALDSATVDGAAYLTPDGTTAVLGTDRKANTDHDLYWSVRASASDPWPTPVELAALDSPAADWSPMLSADQQTLLFVSYRSGGGDLYTSEREGDTFAAPTVIEELVSPQSDADPWLSPDGSMLVFSSDRDTPGTQALYVTTR